MSGGLLAVHAHPDDESITMGATLARYAAAGVPVTLVTATLGEQGELMHGHLAGLAAERADQLGGYRFAELVAACRAMGVTDHRMLGGLGRFRDSGMAGSPSAAHPRAFCRASAGGPDHDEAVGALAAVIDEVRPRVVLTYGSDGGYGHPDHVAAHQVTVSALAAVAGRSRLSTDGDGASHGGVASRGDDRSCGDGRDGGRGASGGDGDGTRRGATGGDGAIRLLAVTRPRAAFARALEALWQQAMPDGYLRVEAGELDVVGFLSPDEAVDVAVSAGPWRAARRAAMAAHSTQLRVWAGSVDGYALTNLRAQPLLERECYRVLAGPAAPAAATDLFAGL